MDDDDDSNNMDNTHLCPYLHLTSEEFSYGCGMSFRSIKSILICGKFSLTMTSPTQKNSWFFGTSASIKLLLKLWQRATKPVGSQELLNDKGLNRMNVTK